MPFPLPQDTRLTLLSCSIWRQIQELPPFLALGEGQLTSRQTLHGEISGLHD